MNKKMKILLFIFLLIPLLSYGQIDTWRKYNKNDGFCSESLYLYNDSTYFYETGCEERSHINFGNWIIKNNIIQLMPIDTSKFNYLISSTQDTSICGDSIIIKVLDINDKPVKGFDIIYIPSGIDYKLIDQPGEYSFVKKRKKKDYPQFYRD